MPRALPHVGDRIQIVGVLPGDPDPVPVGSTGTVTNVSPWPRHPDHEPQAQISVAWDDSTRTLMVLLTDPWTPIPDTTGGHQ